MNPTVKRYVISSATTFVSTFAGTMALMVSGGHPLELTTPAILAVLGACGRAAVKAVIESFTGSADK